MWIQGICDDKDEVQCERGAWNGGRNIIEFEEFLFYKNGYYSQIDNLYPWIEMTMFNVKGVLLERAGRDIEVNWKVLSGDEHQSRSQM